MGSEDKDTIVVSEANLVLARTLPVMWDPSESGAPALFDPSGQRLANLDLATYRMVVRTAEVLLDEGKLAPGRYEYDDPLESEPDEFKPFAARRSAHIANGKVAVEVTDQHLLLVKNANLRLRDDGGRDIFVGIDSKRPYGDMTYFYIDMGAILGIAPQGPPRKDRPTQRGVHRRPGESLRRAARADATGGSGLSSLRDPCAGNVRTGSARLRAHAPPEVTSSRVDSGGLGPPDVSTARADSELRVVVHLLAFAGRRRALDNRRGVLTRGIPCRSSDSEGAYHGRTD